MNHSSTQLAFQGHFVCDKSSPCDNSWRFAWTGLTPTDDFYIENVELNLYDLQTYNLTKITLDKEQAIGYTQVIDLEFPLDKSRHFNVYGIVTYNRNLPQNLSLSSYESTFSFHVISYTRYVFHLVPWVVSPFSHSLPPEQTPVIFAPRVDDPTNKLTKTWVGSRINHHDETKAQFNQVNQFNQIIKSSKLPAATTTTPTYISPTITFNFPFYKLQQKQREQILDPEQPSLFDKIEIYLFGLSKWVYDAKIDPNGKEINTTCYINSVPVKTNISVGSQDQLLSVSVNSYIYRAVITPMVQFNQTYFNFHCNGNVWMYYHPDVIAVTPEYIPNENLTVIFTKGNPATKSGNFDQNVTQNCPQNDNTIEVFPNHGHNEDQFSSKYTTSWLNLADVVTLDRNVYNNTKTTTNTIVKMIPSSTTTIPNTSLTLPDSFHPENVGEYQKSWVRCNFGLEWSDKEFLKKTYNLDTTEFSLEIEASLNYALTKDSTYGGNDDDDDDDKIPPIIDNALLMFSPSRQTLISTEFNSQPQAYAIPLSYTKYPKIEEDGLDYKSTQYQYKSTKPLVLNDNLVQLIPNRYFKQNKTDYSYLDEQYFTLYYPIDISKNQNEFETYSFQCNLKINYLFKLYPETKSLLNEKSDDKTLIKSLSTSFMSRYSPAIFDNIMGDHVSDTFNTDLQNSSVDLLKDVIVLKNNKHIGPPNPNPPHFNRQNSNPNNSDLVQDIKFDMKKQDSIFNITLSLNFESFENSSKLQYLTLYPTEGLHFFKFSSDREHSLLKNEYNAEGIYQHVESQAKSQNIQKYVQYCTMNVTDWVIKPSVISEIMPYLRFAFEKTTDGTSSNEEVVVNIQCPFISMLSTYPKPHGIQTDMLPSDQCHTRLGWVNAHCMDKKDLTIEKVMDIYTPYKEFNIFDTLLFTFQYSNSTHLKIFEYNLPNPTPSQPPRNPLKLFILLSIGGTFAIFIILAILSQIIKCCKTKKQTNHDLTGIREAHYLSLNYDDSIAQAV
jgi:hypothetical protein